MLRWQRDGLGGVVARIAGSEGLGGAARGELVAFGDSGERVGGLLGGLLDAQIERAAEQLRGSEAPSALIEATIDHGSAQRAGLACGGQANALVQRVADIPEDFWSTLARREPAALVMTADGQSTLSLPGSTPLPDEVATVTAELLERGAPSAISEADGSILIQSFHPGRRLLVVGEAALAHALTRQAALLGWGAELVDDLPAAEAALAELQAGDAVVVMTHDPAIDAPVLADALRRGIGYVGALGSRRTQTRRAEALAGLGSRQRRDRAHLRPGRARPRRGDARRGGARRLRGGARSGLGPAARLPPRQPRPDQPLNWFQKWRGVRRSRIASRPPRFLGS